MPQSARGGRACQGRPRTSSGILRLTARSTSSGPGGALALVTSGEPRTSFSLQAACINTKNSFSSDRSFEICSLAVLNGSLLSLKSINVFFWPSALPANSDPGTGSSASFLQIQAHQHIRAVVIATSNKLSYS